MIAVIALIAVIAFIALIAVIAFIVLIAVIAFIVLIAVIALIAVIVIVVMIAAVVLVAVIAFIVVIALIALNMLIVMVKKRKKNGSCYYCKRPLIRPMNPMRSLSATMDYTHPKSEGGRRRVPCCFACNNMKGNMSLNDWYRFINSTPEWWKRWKGYRNHG